ncbi:hypothetical protein BDZ91DRAFT_729593 [Kalaharituber pfeilii]|nr:hypothetical protein BDZ91DRAFT_729593 [Kalaharituber pfeilii]
MNPAITDCLIDGLGREEIHIDEWGEEYGLILGDEYVEMLETDEAGLVTKARKLNGGNKQGRWVEQHEVRVLRREAYRLYKKKKDKVRPVSVLKSFSASCLVASCIARSIARSMAKTASYPKIPCC